MAPDPQLSNILKWSIENSVDANPADPASAALKGRAPNPEALAALFSTKSEAEQMKDAMHAIQDGSLSLEDRIVAFDNFEQLIESLDNANNLAPLGLWGPLVGQLGSPESKLRRMAAWCVGTAVQNNPASQKEALEHGAMGKLVRMALDETESDVQRKACYAISSEVRNYQAGMDAVRTDMHLDPMDATDMEAIDAWMAQLRK